MTELQPTGESTAVETSYGELINLFSGAIRHETGEIFIPPVRIMLPGFESPATVSTQLLRTRQFDTGNYEGHDEKIIAQLASESPHECSIVYNRRGDAYAIRNIYPFGSNWADEDSRPIRFSRVDISIEFDNDGALSSEEYDALLKEIEEFEEERLNNPTRERQLSFNDTLFPVNTPLDYSRLKNLLLTVRAGDTLAVAPFNQEDYTLDQSLDILSFNQFGVVGNEGRYYEKLTPGAPDPLGFFGGSLLVPLDIDALRTIKIAFISRDSDIKEIN